MPAGSYSTVPSGLRVTSPTVVLWSTDATVSEVPSGSLSFDRTAIVRGVSSSVAPVSSAERGEALTGAGAGFCPPGVPGLPGLPPPGRAGLPGLTKATNSG